MSLQYPGSRKRTAKVQDIRTYRGGQEYLYIHPGGVLMTLVNARAAIETAINTAVTTADATVSVVFDNMPFTTPGKNKKVRDGDDRF